MSELKPLYSVEETLRIQTTKLNQQLNKLLEQNTQIIELTAERDNALSQVEQLKGIKPELPPRPPQGDGLPRYGIKWNGNNQPISTPMDDGYWTPYHLALAQNAELVAQVEAVRQVRAEAVLVAANSCRFMADINTDDGVFKREICLLEDLEQYAELAKGGEV